MRINLRVALISLVSLVTLGAAWPALVDSGLIGPYPAGGNQKSVTLVVDYGVDSKRRVQYFDLMNLSNDVTGWDLFKKAQLTVQGTDQFSTGFVCRVAGWPKPKNQDCSDTPTYSEGHWAYYVTNSSLGSGWLLSGQGAATHKPECAGYEGWSWIAPGEDSHPPRFETKARACQ